jgi:hypothetical protein
MASSSLRNRHSPRAQRKIIIKHQLLVSSAAALAVGWWIDVLQRIFGHRRIRRAWSLGSNWPIMA